MTKQGPSSSQSAQGFDGALPAGGFFSFVTGLGLVLSLIFGGVMGAVAQQTAPLDAQRSNVTALEGAVANDTVGNAIARIGLIDLDGVLRASAGVARVRELLDEQRLGFQREFAERETALQEAERKLVAQRAELDEEEFARRLADFEASVTQIQKEIQYRREAIDVAFQEAQSKLRSLAIQIVTELAQERQLDLVLFRESALIFLPDLNLSDEVLRRLDERTKNARIEVTVNPAGTTE